MIQTFICEWDTAKLCSLVVAEETLRAKVMQLRKMKAELANEQYDKMMEGAKW